MNTDKNKCCANSICVPKFCVQTEKGMYMEVFVKIKFALCLTLIRDSGLLKLRNQ